MDVKFYDVEKKSGVNLVDAEKLQFLPRVGELVMLPGVERAGRGLYEVDSVFHEFNEDGNEYANPIAVRVNVKLSKDTTR